LYVFSVNTACYFFQSLPLSLDTAIVRYMVGSENPSDDVGNRLINWPPQPNPVFFKLNLWIRSVTRSCSLVSSSSASSSAIRCAAGGRPTSGDEGVPDDHHRTIGCDGRRRAGNPRRFQPVVGASRGHLRTLAPEVSVSRRAESATDVGLRCPIRE